MHRVRALFLAFGLLEVLVPRRIVRWGERLALENPGAGRLRPWTLPMARLEGVVFCWLVCRDRSAGSARASSILAGVLGVIGLPALVFPKPFVTGALGTAYENPRELEVKPWVVPFTRLLGALYLVVALFAGRVDAPEDESAAEGSTGP